MKYIWRSLLILICGGIMALAALAGQVGYEDDYGRRDAGLSGGDTAARLPVSVEMPHDSRAG
jgi:hypothetical protein